MPDEQGANQQRKKDDGQLQWRDFKSEQAFEPPTLASKAEAGDGPHVEHKGDRQSYEEADRRRDDRHRARGEQLIRTAEAGELCNHGCNQEQHEWGDEHQAGDAAPGMRRARAASLVPAVGQFTESNRYGQPKRLPFSVRVDRNPLAESILSGAGK